jgi:hypothetical protein
LPKCALGWPRTKSRDRPADAEPATRLRERRSDADHVSKLEERPLKNGPPGGEPGGGANQTTRRDPSPTKPSLQDRALDALLRDRWPELFDPDRPLPLAMEIRSRIANALDLASPERRRLQTFMSGWCSRGEYLRALAADGALRFDIDGSTTEVSPEHQHPARERFATRRAERRAHAPRRGANARLPTLRLARAP